MDELKTTTSQAPSLKSIYLAVIVVGAATGANLWLNRGDLPLGYARFTGYGFSIVYPQLYDYYDWGDPDPSTGPNEFGGGVQFKKYWEGTWNNVMVMWSTETSTPDLETMLAEFYESVDSWGCHVDEKYQLLTSEQDGYEMLCQTFTFTEESFRPGGARFIATTCVWCEPWPSLRSNRVYMFTYIAFLETTTYQESQDNFRHYLESFNGRIGTSMQG
ncbi:hypothetical protein JXL21_10990 [Candidatus Bathyarchaeota archaeon]|nr:hypothetical protein [Candidatus Bathyarchaeota archaeon]